MGISGCLYNVFGRFSIERRFLKGSQGFSIEKDINGGFQEVVMGTSGNFQGNFMRFIEGS